MSFWRSDIPAGKRAMAALGIAVAGEMLLAHGAAAATLRIEDVVMTGLANPRGIAIGPDGGLYVAEAGQGGDGPAIQSGSGAINLYGSSSGVSRLLDGAQERVVSNLPSLAPSGGGEATGAHDVAFTADGTMVLTMGFGADPALRADLPEAGQLLGHIVTASGGSVVAIADLAAFEADENPDGGGLNSNPFGLVARPDGTFVASDAGGNDVLTVAVDGTVTAVAVAADRPNPAFPTLGGPTYQAVPTGLAAAPDGSVVVGELTGFPFLAGEATIRGLATPELLDTVASGFTGLIDVAFDATGTLFALELDSDGLFPPLGPETTGSLYSVAADGSKALLFDGLIQPSGLAVGEDGLIYVATNGLSPTEGQVLALAPVPLPAGLPLLAAGLGAVAALSRRRRAASV